MPNSFGLHDMLGKDYAPKTERIANINKRLAQIPAMVDGLRPKLRRPPQVLRRAPCV